MKKTNTLLKISLLGFVLWFTNCTSVATYNKKLDTPISVEKLHKDIDYVQHKLQKLHPQLYLYISEEALEFKFDSLKKSIDQPLTSKDFYFKLSPIIASVKQGHMILYAPSKKMEKKEVHRLSKTGLGPLSQFDFDWIDKKLYITKNRSTQKTIPLGAEVIKINDLTPQALYQKYSKTFSSDGYNKTYIDKGFSKRFTSYVTSEIGIHDSLHYTLFQHDSLKEFTVHRLKLEKKKIKKDSIASSAVVSKKILSKKEKRIMGYDEVSKNCSKEVSFLSQDSLVAVLKLRDFSKGHYAKAYKTIFEQLHHKGTHTLIIDIRDNPGGKVADVVDLYSYLTDQPFTMLQPAEVTSKTSLWKLGLFRKMPSYTYPILGVFYPFYMAFSTMRTQKHEDGTYTYSLVGSKKRKNNPLHFTGKIYVIINGGSFSASCLLASSLKSNPTVTFVGEETGGGSNATVAGLLPILKLPYSKLYWRLGLMNIKTTHQDILIGHGVYPDVPIPHTVFDEIQNNDPEIDWIKNEISIRKE
ncbi:S41 family peptidase [Flavobacterium aciduliphilum]|uniref:Peptidase S41-like protein n=1 Tax=Flavobacterium aciduliphilum TaxID=1101402 RepID=A0A328YA85_9FLAO|nr:S41 family peptidase [Flavobacterium aciduliphilum]RAR70094.1 peptidase S41-like protein [Flavobacterium aciduliphilum]